MGRRFIAIDLPEEVRDTLTDVGLDGPELPWTPPGQLHVTLRFIGPMPQGDRALRTALAELRRPRFAMAIAGVGTFPAAKTPRVLWAGVDAPSALFDLQRGIERVVRELGHPPQRRRFRPHVTLARLPHRHREVPPDDGGPPLAARFVMQHALLRTPPFTVRDFVLKDSVLHPHGSRYRDVARFELAPNARLNEGE